MASPPPAVKSTQRVLWSVFPVCLCFINPWSRVALRTLPPSKLKGPMLSVSEQTKIVKVVTGCSLKKDHQYRFINLPGKKKKFAWTHFLKVDSGRRPHPDFTCGWQHLVKVSYKLQKCDQSHKWASPEWSANLPMAGKISTFFTSWPSLKTLETLATLLVKIYVNKWWILNKYGYRFSYTWVVLC